MMDFEPADNSATTAATSALDISYFMKWILIEAFRISLCQPINASVSYWPFRYAAYRSSEIIDKGGY